MIIGVSGYAGSGKDTVGSIIQYLNSECSKLDGKHYRTYDEYLKKSNGNNDFQTWYNSDWEVKKWAGKLKTVASLLTGIDASKFEDQEFKKTNLDLEWSTLKMKPGKRQDGIFPKKIDMDMVPMTVRDLLQKLGTDAVRVGLHENAWVNALLCDYRPSKMSEYNPSKWVVTDTRFPNEAEAIESRNGVVVRVVRPGYKPINAHPSETALDDYPFDFILENNGDINHLIEQVRKMLDIINKK